MIKKHLWWWLSVLETVELLHICVFKSHFSKVMLSFRKATFKMIKSDSKDIYNVTKDSVSNKCCSFERSIHQRSWQIKCITVTLLIIINLDHQILILEWFLKMTLKTGAMMINSALIIGINYTLLHIHIENSWFTL